MTYKKTTEHSPNFIQPLPDLIDGEEEYKVKAIIGHQRRPGRWTFLIWWRGSSAAEDTWELECNLGNAKSLIEEYKITQPKDFPEYNHHSRYLSPHLPHLPQSPHGHLHCLACICSWQDHHSWKELCLGSSGSILTLHTSERYKASLEATVLPETCLLRTISPMSTSSYCSPSMLSFWHLWQNTSHNNFGDSSSKVLRPKISHPRPLHHHHFLPPNPQRKMVLSLHMPHCRLPHLLYSQSGWWTRENNERKKPLWLPQVKLPLHSPVLLQYVWTSILFPLHGTHMWPSSMSLKRLAWSRARSCHDQYNFSFHYLVMTLFLGQSWDPDLPIYISDISPSSYYTVTHKIIPMFYTFWLFIE